MALDEKERESLTEDLLTVASLCFQSAIMMASPQHSRRSATNPVKFAHTKLTSVLNRIDQEHVD